MRLLASLLLALPAVALGQVTQVPDVAGLTPEELDALPEEVVATLPARELLRKLLGITKLNVSEDAVDVILTVPLSELFYLAPPTAIGPPERSAAIRAFQAS